MRQILFTILLAAATIGGADAYGWATLLLAPGTGVVSWFAGRHTRNNDTVQKLQDTIDMLVKKNSELYAQITEQNKTISKLNETIADQGLQIAELKRVIDAKE